MAVVLFFNPIILKIINFTRNKNCTLLTKTVIF